jgi:Ser/Thr protein kinase RdoA (MazF antagonist)
VHNDWILRNILVAADGVDYVVDFDSMRARADLRWLDVAYLLLNIESQIKWFPLLTAGMLAELSREFWRGYAGDTGLPDNLSPEQLVAILYVLRLRYLLGVRRVRPISGSWTGRWIIARSDP